MHLSGQTGIARRFFLVEFDSGNAVKFC